MIERIYKCCDCLKPCIIRMQYNEENAWVVDPTRCVTDGELCEWELVE